MKAAATPKPTSNVPETAASHVRRLVQASGLVRPRTPSPSGPATRATPVTAATAGAATAPAIPAKAMSPSAIEPHDDSHHRSAKRLTDPPR